MMVVAACETVGVDQVGGLWGIGVGWWWSVVVERCYVHRLRGSQCRVVEVLGWWWRGHLIGLDHRQHVVDSHGLSRRLLPLQNLRGVVVEMRGGEGCFFRGGSSTNSG